MSDREWAGFKKFWLEKLRFWGVLTLLVLSVLGLRFLITRGRMNRVEPGYTVSDSAHPVIRNDELQRLDYNGLVVLMENENLTFAVDFNDGNIEVTNRVSGYVWRSKPSPAEMAIDESNNLWRNIAQSPLYVEFVNHVHETLHSMLHVGSPGYRADVFRLPDGIRVYHQFTVQGISVALDYYLHKDHLEVDIPNYMVQETPMTFIVDGGRLVHDPTVPSALIFNMRVLPFFGASQDRDIHGSLIDGFMFVPDGPGALIRFDENRDFFNTYSGAIYGNDFSFFSVINNAVGQQRWFPRIHFPAFGINRGSDSLLGIIHQGESNARVNAYPAGVRTSFNNVHAQFNYRARYIRFHNMIGDGTMRFTDSMANATRNVRYYFLTGDDDGYVGMAGAYRQYMMDVKGLNRRPSGNDLPMELSLYGGDREYGFLITPFLTMTTFKQGQEIVQFFIDNGVTEMNIIYNAWFRNGNAVRFPNRFPPARQLGGKNGLRDFVGFAHDNGLRVFLSDWNLYIENTRGIVRSRDVIYDIQDTPLNWGTFANPMYVLNATAMRRVAERSLEEYRWLGIDGIFEFSSDYLISNQGTGNRMHREETQREVNALYQHISDELGRIYLWRGMTFGLVDGAAVVDPANTYSFSPLISEYVPFYHIALRGLIDLITVPVNTMANPEVSILQAAEYGMNLSYILTYAPTEDLFFAYNSWMLTSSQFDIFKHSFLEMYNRWNYAFAEVEGKFITNHENIADNVFRTTYETGLQVIVNYRDEAFEYGGIFIPPLDFALQRNGRVYVP
jgi:hypothetical protein